LRKQIEDELAKMKLRIQQDGSGIEELRQDFSYLKGVFEHNSTDLNTLIKFNKELRNNFDLLTNKKIMVDQLISGVKKDQEKNYKELNDLIEGSFKKLQQELR